jgi:hypothetical protein
LTLSKAGVAYRVALDEPGLRCYQGAVETDKVGSEADCMGRG